MATNVLIVEDESIVALDLQRRLIAMGYQVPCVASTHDQALQAIDDHNPDIVLMDINIAGQLDGICTAAKMTTPVIYLTGHSDEAILKRAEETKPYGFLIKPVLEQELHATIQMAVQHSSYEKQLQANEVQLRVLNSTLEQRVEERTAELKSALQNLHLSQEELARNEANAMLSTLSASVSHELSSPIGNSLLAATTVSNLTKKIRLAMEENKLTKSILENTVSDLEAAASLTEKNLLRADHLLNSFRQVAADQSSHQKRRFDLAITLREIIDTISPSLRQKSHRIQMNLPADITMNSEPGALGQIAINLINNAYLHAFENRTDGILTISAVPDNDWVNLHFCDNGVGMSEETQQLAFQLFYSTRIGRGGTGLGLAIVENLTKSLGGEVQIRSKIGSGTCFDIRLPLAMPDAISPER